MSQDPMALRRKPTALGRAAPGGSAQVYPLVRRLGPGRGLFNNPAAKTPANATVLSGDEHSTRAANDGLWQPVEGCQPPLIVAEARSADRSDWLSRHSRFRRLHDYLAAKAPGRMPCRDHIDPLEITDLLPYIMLIDVVGPPPSRFRFRLIGTAFVEALGREFTGQWLDEALHPDYAPQITSMCSRVASLTAPLHWRIRNPVSGREFVHFECVFFPLSADQVRVDMLLVVHALTDDIPAAQSEAAFAP